MKRLVKAALLCALALGPTASWANACAGGTATTHEVRIQWNGFFPTKLYACPGDTVRFVNMTGRYAMMSVKDPNYTGVGYYINRLGWFYQSGGYSTISYTIPHGYPYLVLGEIDLYGVSNNDKVGYIMFSPAPTG